MFNQESRDSCLVILAPGFPPLLIPLVYESSYWHDSGYFIFLLDNDRIEGLISRLAHPERIRIQFPPYLARLMLRNIMALSGLVLVTYYQQMNHEKAIAATSIGLDGDISQQILKDCLDYERLQQALTCHWWLVSQSLGVFYSKIRDWGRWCNRLLLGGGTVWGGMNLTQNFWANSPLDQRFLQGVLIVCITAGLILLQIYFPKKMPSQVSQTAFLLGIVSPQIKPPVLANPLSLVFIVFLSFVISQRKTLKNHPWSQWLLRFLERDNITLLEVSLEIVLLIGLIVYLHWVPLLSNVTLFSLTFLAVIGIFRLRDRLPVLLQQWLWRRILRKLLIDA